MSIHNLRFNVTNPLYESAEFRTILEAHRAFILATGASMVTVPATMEIRYVSDFTGLLAELNIDRKLWWITMRLNGMHTAFDYVGNLPEIIVPYDEVIDTLLSTHLSNR